MKPATVRSKLVKLLSEALDVIDCGLPPFVERVEALRTAADALNAIDRPAPSTVPMGTLVEGVRLAPVPPLPAPPAAEQLRAPGEYRSV